VIKEWGVWNDGEGGIAKPSVFLVQPDMSISYSYVGRDFADRPPDDDFLVARAEAR
jgi:peroxiredoxin